MKPITLTIWLTLFSLTLLLSACSQESTTPIMDPKPALNAANKAAGLAATNAGQRIYEDTCASCHNSGLMGAPKLGDKADWVEPLESSLEELTQNTINGKGKMPPKGGNSKLSDQEVKAAVEYMVNKSK
jgi:cytochrome c5